LADVAFEDPLHFGDINGPSTTFIADRTIADRIQRLQRRRHCSIGTGCSMFFETLWFEKETNPQELYGLANNSKFSIFYFIK